MALAIIGSLGPMEIMVILFIGLLVFGSRLPEVGRSLGKSLVEFKKGLRGIKDEVDSIDRESDRLVNAELKRQQPPFPLGPPPEIAVGEGHDAHYGDLDRDDPRHQGDDAGDDLQPDPTEDPGAPLDAVPSEVAAPAQGNSRPDEGDSNPPPQP